MTAIKTQIDRPDASAVRFPKTSDIPETDVTRAIERVNAALAGYQPLDSDLTAIAALSTTTYGRSLLTLANVAALAASLVSELDASFLTPAEGNAAYQPLDSDLTAIAALSTTSYGRSLLTTASVAALAASLVSDLDASFLTPAEGNAAYQPLDSDLTAIAALSTTSYGRALLTLADAAALTALSNAFAGDSGSGGVKGLVPAPAAGDAAANKFLKANGAWAAVGGGSGDLVSTNNLSDVASAIASFNNLTARGSDIASASTINLSTATGVIVDVTGTTTITAITLADGDIRIVRFTGALTLTNGASLVLPGGSNITTAAGDFAIFAGYASSVVRCLSYVKASGKAVVPSADSDITGSAWTSYTPTVSAQSGTITTSSATGRYRQIGKIVVAQMDVILTTVGTATGSLIVSLPVTAASNKYVGTSFEYNTTSKSGACFTNTTTGAWTRDATGTTYFTNGYRVAITITYEAA